VRYGLWMRTLSALLVVAAACGTDRAGGGGSETHWVACESPSECETGFDCVEGKCSPVVPPDPGAGGAGSGPGDPSGGVADPRGGTGGAGATSGEGGRTSESGAGGVAGSDGDDTSESGAGGVAGSGGDGTSTCKQVLHNGSWIREESLEEFCKGDNCPESLEDAVTPDPRCTDVESDWQQTRSVGCGYTVVEIGTLWVRRFYFNEEGTLVGGLYGDDVIEDDPCADADFVAGDVPDDCGREVVCDLCTESTNVNGPPACPSCETTVYGGELWPYVSLDEFCGDEPCPATVEEAEAVTSPSACTAPFHHRRETGCGYTAISLFSPETGNTSRRLYFDSDGQLMGGLQTDDITGRHDCGGPDKIAGDIPESCAATETCTLCPQAEGSIPPC
jgi:hypothetical protein